MFNANSVNFEYQMNSHNDVVDQFEMFSTHRLNRQRSS